MTARVFLLSCGLILAIGALDSKAKDPPPIPDFTKGDRLERNAPHDWNLGPTGARGWVYAFKGASTPSRQILITEVGEKSPADGVLEKDDVIVGLGGQPFESDARIALARAITEAEASDGVIELVRWRSGRTEAASLRIPVLGTYSATAPFQCEKSDAIFRQGCEAIARNIENPDGRRRHAIVRSLNALALLASGEQRYLPLVKREVEWASEWEISEGDLHCWPAGWVNLLLAEYVLVTGDDSYLPAIEKLCREISEGQSHVGTWGHRFAYEHNGILRGYGAMNQVGLSLTVSMVTAREAGVDYGGVDEAIEKSARFLSFYAGRGAIPYGDHHPWLQMHDDNGKASAAAVLFDLLGDGEKAEFFARMGTASYGVERETGHTGNFFNMLWALPAISRGGPEATGAWMRESAWLLDLARRHDGTFDFLGKPGATGGEHSYRGWDCTGAYLVGLAVARKQTLLTGARASTLKAFSRDEVATLIEDGRGWAPDTREVSYDERSTEELLENLANWSPVVRERAALALARRADDEPRLVDRLVEMAEDTGNRNARFGACAAFEQFGVKGAKGVPALVRLLDDEDYWLQAQAAEALAGLGEPARVAVPKLLELVAEPPRPEDTRSYLQRYLAFALFNRREGLLGKSLEDVDREQLRAAALAVLQNEDGRARGSLQTVYDQLTEVEIEPMLPAIHEAVVNQSPSGVMFSDGIRLAGLGVLAEHRVAEGIPLCIDLIELERWGAARRIGACLDALESYGGSAKAALPKIRAFAKSLYEHPQFEISKPDSRRHNADMAKRYERLMEIVAEIESAESSAPLRSLEG